ncbi:MAG: hypothetical protein AAFR22_26560, partial [Chloroflexota bacterium]
YTDESVRRLTRQFNVQVLPVPVTVPEEIVTNPGQSVRIPVTVTNTGTTARAITLTDTLPAQIAPDPERWSQNPVVLAANQATTTYLTVTLPYDDQNCPVDTDYTISITDNGNYTAQTLLKVQNAPVLTNVIPEIQLDGSATTIGNSLVTFSWQSTLAGGDAYVYISETGVTGYTQHALTVDGNVAFGQVMLMSGKTYDWYPVHTLDNCLTTSATPPANMRQIDVRDGVQFTNGNSGVGYAFDVVDGYDITRHIISRNVTTNIPDDFTPMTIEFMNQSSSESKQVQIAVENPHDDLIIGFTGPGSIDATTPITLAPGQAGSQTLRVFSQETQTNHYMLTLTITDLTTGAMTQAPLEINIERPSLSDISIT